MTVPSLLEEPGRVDEPQAAQEYSAVLTQVAAEHRPVIVRRNGADLAAVVPLEHLEMLREAVSRRKWRTRRHRSMRTLRGRRRDRRKRGLTTTTILSSRRRNRRREPAALSQLGSVVWVELEDANGIPKLRPAIVVTATADIAAGKPVRVVAITTRLLTPLPHDYVLLPWDRQGKARLGPAPPMRRRGQLAGGGPGRRRTTSGGRPTAHGDRRIVGQGRRLPVPAVTRGTRHPAERRILDRLAPTYQLAAPARVSA